MLARASEFNGHSGVREACSTVCGDAHDRVPCFVFISGVARTLRHAVRVSGHFEPARPVLTEQSAYTVFVIKHSFLLHSVTPLLEHGRTPLDYALLWSRRTFNSERPVLVATFDRFCGGVNVAGKHGDQEDEHAAQPATIPTTLVQPAAWPRARRRR